MIAHSVLGAMALKAGNMSVDILCLGEPMVEFNQQSDGHFLQGFGGDTSNCAIAAARQGADVGYMTLLGDDGFGRSILDLWRQEGVDSNAVQCVAGSRTGIYFVTHGEAGHRFSYYREGSASARITPADLYPAAFEGIKLLHVSGISQAISSSAADTTFAAIEMAKKAGAQISYDTNLRLSLWPLDRARAITHAAMQRCDIALPGLDDARHLLGTTDPDRIADFYLDLGASIVALTVGAEGCLVALPDERRRIPGREVQAIDATGAGDTFDGAFLARHIAGDDPFEAGRYANAAAALSTCGYGAISPMPRADEVRRFMAELE